MRPDDFSPLKLPPQVALANFYPFAKGERAGAHWSESDLYLPATGGRGFVQIGPQRFELRSGQVLHVPWGAPLLYEADSRDPFVLIGVHLKYLPWEKRVAAPLHTSRNVDLRRASMQSPPCPQPFSEAFLLAPPAESPLINLGIAIAKAYENAGRDDSEEREATLRALALQFVLEVRRLQHGQELIARHPQAGVVREIVSWLELSYRRPIKRRELAERAGISETALANAFRAITGRAPIDFLIDLRLSHARARLTTTRQRISEVAESVGIPDVYYFSKLFKRRVGVSPLQYRKQRRF
ncbi:MAG TPA: helix-turn-helix domain-containing protein [Planctomycetota bacterium]|nr:helix-turn-helix domain-containing protein [Planctomycetota bacterium]